MSSQHMSMQPQTGSSGCGEDAAGGGAGPAMQPQQGQGGFNGSVAQGAFMGQGQAQGQNPSMGQGQAAGHPQEAAQGAYMGQGQDGAQGPDMGQPHFSAQIPGAAPYQGQPGAFVYGQPMAGYYSMGEQQAGRQAGRQGFGGDAMGAQGGYAPQAGAMGGYAGAFAQAPGNGGAPGMNPGQAMYGGQAFAGQQGSAMDYAQAMGRQYAASAPGVQIPGASPGYGQENRYGELYGLIQEAANGNPDVSKFLNFFTQSSTEFWKGALIGTGLTLLLTNDTVKGALSGAFASVWGAFGKSAEEMEEEEDRKAEQRLANKE
ncbi:MAG: hypothetical protein AB7D07_02915 [Desulfovibrionaceae bacterium]